MICTRLLGFQHTVQDGIPHPMVIAPQTLMKGGVAPPKSF